MSGDRATTRPPERDRRFRVPLRGTEVDDETRCGHWDSAVDVVAIRFPCCGVFYPCFDCHDRIADHQAERWPRERFDEDAVLCGVCRETLSVQQYLDCDDACPACGAAFNPGCRRHRDRYFDP